MKHYVDDSSFSSYTPESCYWAGFLAADGNIKKDNASVFLKLKADDEGHLRKFCRFLKRDEDIYKYNETLKSTRKTYKSSVLYFRSNKIVNDLLNNFNITQKKSLTLLPPVKIPVELVSHYIRGYMDGDGSICFKKERPGIIRLHIVSGSRNLMEWVVSNIKGSVNAGNTNMTKRMAGSPIYEIEFSGRGANNALAWIYYKSNNEIRLDRKYNRYISQEKNQEE